MKKVFIAMMMAFAACITIAAATPAEESAKRIETLQKMLEKMPAASGISEIDQYVTQSAAAAKLAVENSILLTDVTANGVAADKLAQLALNLKNEQEALQEAVKLAPKAAEGLKSLGKNPMKAGKAKKALDFGNNASQIVTEETVYQAQVIAELSK